MDIIMLSVIAAVIVAIYIFYYFYTKSTQTQMTDNAKKDLEAAADQLAISKNAEDAAKKIAESAHKNEQNATQNTKNALEKKELADKAVSDAKAQLKMNDDVIQKQIAELNLVKQKQQQTEANYNYSVSELEKNKKTLESLNANLNICNTSQDTLKNTIKKYEADILLLSTRNTNTDQDMIKKYEADILLLKKSITKYEADIQSLNSIIAQNKTLIDKQLNDIKVEQDNNNKQKNFFTQVRNNMDNNWNIYKGNSSYVVARINNDTKTQNDVLYECLAADGKNCYWKQSYDAAMNDLKNLPPNIKPASGNWMDLVKLTGPPAPAPWKVCKHPSGTFVVARDDTSTFQKSSECVATDGANCFWRGDRDTATNDLNNLPSPIKPVKGDWGLTC